MKRFALPLLIVFVAVVAATVIVSAQHKHVAGKGHEEISPLPVEVRSKVEKLNLEHRIESIDLQARQAQLCGQMQEELLKDKPDAKVLEKIAKEMDAARAKMHRQRIEHLLKVKQALPAEHWKVFLHKHGGSCACGHCGHGAGAGCAHGAGGQMRGAGGQMRGAAGCMHGAGGMKRGAAGCCTHGAGAGCAHGAGGQMRGARAGCTHGAAGCMHGAGGVKHGATGCPMMAPAAADAEICPLGKHEKGKQ